MGNYPSSQFQIIGELTEGGQGTVLILKDNVRYNIRYEAKIPKYLFNLEEFKSEYDDIFHRIKALKSKYLCIPLNTYVVREGKFGEREGVV